MQDLQNLFQFIDDSPSPFHAVAQAAERLRRAGFCPLKETQPWALAPGGCYYTTRNASSIIAFRLPREERLTGWRMALSHSDSPTWRVKTQGRPDANGYIRLETEGYGGMIVSTWLDRPLTLAGRLLVETERGVESRLVYPDRDLLIIPNMCIHFDREVNKGRSYDLQNELQPLYGQSGAESLMELLAREAQAEPEQILHSDLSLCPRQKMTQLGAAGEFFAGPRIDDLECAFTTLEGFLEAKANPGMGQLWSMSDNEEVGSGSRQGAQGTFLRDVLERVRISVWPGADGYAVLANSFALSADNAHAVHPARPEKSDPEHAPRMNGGVVVKQTASQKYTTTGLTAALFARVCRDAGVPVQQFANRADVAGGGTLGNLQSQSVSVPMVDIGLAQLAMHSCVETAGAADPAWMRKAAAAFYSAPFTCVDDGWYDLP